MSMKEGGAAAGPGHVAIIMDGNGRWAEERGMSRSAGHQKGAERVREIVKVAPDLGIRVLTLFAFSTENWRRPGYEVSVLMSLFRRYIVREVDALDQDEVEVRFLGDRSRLPRDLRRLMTVMEERTRGHTKLRLQIALSYGARAEIVHAVRHLAAEVEAGRRSAESIDEAAISAALYTGGVPDPDLVIRTSGEFRISNFLLWQAAYSEFAFVDECWPEFDVPALERVLASYGTRERRFGGLRASG
ncbi:MAG TPA: isoprenyl transferase [Thermohalobaculum sp.]|nr:isoprenyl transferase [Thermohalobaculum sp.]